MRVFKCCLCFCFSLWWSLPFLKFLFWLLWLVCHPVFLLYRCLLEDIPVLLSTITRDIKLLLFNKLGKIKKTHVVIIGGGFLGSTVAQMLQFSYNIHITLIDKKNYFEYTPSVPRAAVDLSHKRVIQVPHTHYLYSKRVTLLQEMAQSVGVCQVSLSNQEKINFDYLVLATGSSYCLPAGLKSSNVFPADSADEVSRAYERLIRSKHVLVIGGGITGVELAAEIATHFSYIHVTIVHSGGILLPGITETEIPRNYVSQFFMRHNVTVLLNHRVISELPDFSGFLTDKTNIKADIAFLCGCRVPNNYHLTQELLKKDVKLVPVNQCLQVKGYHNIFSGGDIADIQGDNDEEKLAQTAEIQAEIIVDNILTLQEYSVGSKIPFLESYTPRRRIKVISLGKYDGIIVWGSWCLTGIIPALLKELIEWKTLARFWNWGFDCGKYVPIFPTSMEPEPKVHHV